MNDNAVHQLATGFEFSESICRDSKSNIYFCDSRMKRIYKYDRISKTDNIVGRLSMGTAYHLLVIKMITFWWYLNTIRKKAIW